MYKEYKKITIKTAKKYFNNNKDFIIIPNKTNINNIWGIGYQVNNLDRTEENFNQLVNNFSYYNCNTKELGLKPAFYVLIN
jgi:hypothetical protein